MIRSAVSDRMAKGRNLGGERHRCVASSLKHGRSRAALIMSLSSSYSYSYIHRNSTTTVIYSSPSASPRRRTDMSTCALWQMGPLPIVGSSKGQTHTQCDHMRARVRHAAKGSYLQRAPRPRPRPFVLLALLSLIPTPPAITCQATEYHSPRVTGTPRENKALARCC